MISISKSRGLPQPLVPNIADPFMASLENKIICQKAISLFYLINQYKRFIDDFLGFFMNESKLEDFSAGLMPFTIIYIFFCHFNTKEIPFFSFLYKC